MSNQNTHSSQIKRNNLVMWIFIGFITYFLLTEHWAHIVPFLPWLILLACFFMHIFMHGGHSHGNHDSNESHSHDEKE